MTPTPGNKSVPQDGDVVWVDFNPVKGNEQAGARPAVILSSAAMHEASRMAIICPVTSNLNPWPAKVFLPEGFSVKGALLVDQVRSVDRTMRGFRFIARIPDEILTEARFKLAALIGIDLFAIARGSGQS
jgi:mRNA-degrading endonuclease toxin of MazEF toxin-antitoxin module